MITNQEDTNLIQNILIGNKQAQKVLYSKYQKHIKNFINNKYPLNNDIDDDVSEILIKIFLNLEQYDPTKSKFSSWVFSITKNYMVDKWRGNMYNANSTINDYDNYFNLQTSNFSVDLSTFENINTLNFISTQISPQDYTILNMKYIEGYNYIEIGDKFNVTSTTISNRVNYLKTKLKEQITEEIF